MKSATLAAILISATTALAQAEDVKGDDTRFRQIGECIAYYAVSSGMDGKKAVDPGTGQVISVLTGELMFEASVLGYDDDKAQTSVVEKLMAQNTVVNEQGTEALAAQYGPMCASLAKTVMKGG